MLRSIKNRIQKYFYIMKDPKKKDLSLSTTYEKYGFSVGKFTYGYHQFFYDGVNLEKIGSFCSIGERVTITGMNHPLEYITTSPIIYFKSRGFIDEDRRYLINESKNRRVVIGNDVWIGTNVTILPSVKIGNGVIIGAGSIVTKDIPDYAVVAGNPAKILKYRFREREIELLNKSQWWNWSDEKIRKHIDALINIEEFLNIISNS